jgi:DNA-3-methyladenine glycosylase II
MTMPYMDEAVEHLHRCKQMRAIIKKVGPFTPKPVQPREYYRVLTFSIISQMLSLKAAATIRERLVAKLKPGKVIPSAMLKLSHEELFSVGLSNAKVRAMHDLARRTEGKVLPLRRFPKLTNDEIIEHLTEVQGIGRWTAEMFLMFGLIRPDVWPVDDLGLRAAVKKMDGLAEMPTKQYVMERGERYAPYRTVACWYLWQSLKEKGV